MVPKRKKYVFTQLINSPPRTATLPNAPDNFNKSARVAKTSKGALRTPAEDEILSDRLQEEGSFL